MIILKTAMELDRMRKAGAIVAQTHNYLAKHIRPGITTAQLDTLAANFIREAGAESSFKGYNGFPAHICTSVNDELVHGIPGPRVLKENDLISIDIGVCYKGYHGDSAWTYAVSGIDPQTQALLDVTKDALDEAITFAKPGNHIGDISSAIQSFVRKAGLSIVEEYTGHGIGRSLHEDPSVPNIGTPGKGPLLRPGMVIAIEPMVNLGQRYVSLLQDGWTVVTRDGSLCAHFEHTVAITSDGFEIFTQREA